MNESPLAVLAENPRRGFGQTRILKGTALVLLLMHLAAAGALVHVVRDFSWWTLALGLLWYLACGFSVTAGYHRLFAHRSFVASRVLRALLLGFGAAACQHSALKWCSDHRVHHRYTDKDLDPYSVRHGFWWAHFGWVISDADGAAPGAPRPRDLVSDPIVRFQDRFWLPLAILIGGVLPAVLGMLWGDPLGAFLVAGPLRIVVTWHSTYAVNSFAHRFGRPTYAPAASARDNFWVALFTLGEGYHSFHHRFQSDYRNGVRWYHYDPTKWLIWGLSRIGFTRELARVPRAAVLAVRTHPARRRRRTARGDPMRAREHRRPEPRCPQNREP